MPRPFSETLKADVTTALLRVSKWSEDSIQLVNEALDGKRRRLINLAMSDISETALKRKVEALRDEALPPLKRTVYERPTAVEPWRQVG